MLRKYTLFIIGGLFFFSCKNNSSNSNITTVSTPLTIQSKLSNAATKKLYIIINNYYYLKESFVNSNEIEVNKTANALLESSKSLLITFSADTLKIEEPYYLIDSILYYTKNIISIEDKSTELKRVPFSSLSNTLYQLINYYQLKGANIYQQYCPMAFNDKGAYWLTNSKEIQNPYFGKKMLECGEVTDIIE